MSLTRWKAAAVVLVAFTVVLVAFGPTVSLPTLATRQDRIFTPAAEPVYVNVYSKAEGVGEDFVYSFVVVNILPEIKRIRGVGTATILGKRATTMRIRLDPDQMRVHNLSPNDIMPAFSVSGIVDWDGSIATKAGRSLEYEYTRIGRFDKPEQFERIILKAGPDGEILRIKDVGRVELASRFADISSDIDRHPSATIVLKRFPNSAATKVIEDVRKKMGEIQADFFPPGMEFQVLPLDGRDMMYAVIETPQGSTLEDTSPRCHELGAIARGIDEVTSVTSLAGYDIRTEEFGPRVGTCLLHLKDWFHRKRTSRQVIEALEERCRTTKVHPECFEPPGVLVFVAASGFSVRVLDRTNANDDGWFGGGRATFLDDLLNRKDLKRVLTYLASRYPRHELVINDDEATRNGVSLASALENLSRIFADDAQSERTLERLVEDPSTLSIRNDHGELAKYRSFLRFRKKPGSDASDR